MADKKLAYPGGTGIQFKAIDSIRKLEARATDGEGPVEDRYEVAFSSEYEVERSGWFGNYREVLDHSPGAVDMSRFESGTAAVLEEHRGAPVGVIESARIDPTDKKGRAVIRFSPTQRGRDAKMDVDAAIRMNISVGYIPQNAERVAVDEKRGDLWKITRWTPVELSLVGVPADPSVGVGRSAGDYPQVEVRDNTKPEVRGMESSDLRQEGITSERERVRGLAEVATTAGLPAERVSEWIQKGTSIEQAQAEAIAHLRTKGAAVAPKDPVMDMPERDRLSYSYARAILRAGDGELDGVEGEVHQELLKARPGGISARGADKVSVLVPMRLREQSWQKRTLDAKTIGKGAELVFEQAGELIELLRNRAFILQLGARLLTGLTAPIAFPRQTGGMNVFWVAENPGTDVTSSDPALGLANLVPKTLQGTTAYSRQFLVQANIDVEMWVRDELAIAHGLALDRAAIHGLGANGEPTGIYKQPNVQVVNFSSTTIANYVNLVAMQTAVANQNALAGSLAYLTCPTAAGKLKSNLDFSAAAAGRPIWDGPFDNGTIAGYKAVATNQVSSVMLGQEATGGSELGCIFGNFMDLIVGLFASMEVIVDPYAQKKRGLIEVTSFQMCDELIRHPESFCRTNQAV